MGCCCCTRLDNDEIRCSVACDSRNQIVKLVLIKLQPYLYAHFSPSTLESLNAIQNKHTCHLNVSITLAISDNGKYVSYHGKKSNNDISTPCYCIVLHLPTMQPLETRSIKVKCIYHVETWNFEAKPCWLKVSADVCQYLAVNNVTNLNHQWYKNRTTEVILGVLQQW